MLGEYTNKKMAATSPCQLQNNTMIETRCYPSSVLCIRLWAQHKNTSLWWKVKVFVCHNVFESPRSQTELITADIFRNLLDQFSTTGVSKETRLTWILVFGKKNVLVIDSVKRNISHQTFKSGKTFCILTCDRCNSVVQYHEIVKRCWFYRTSKIVNRFWFYRTSETLNRSMIFIFMDK